MKINDLITPQVGKRYVTRGGWITPPYQDNGMIYNHDGMWRVNGGDDPFEIIAEYVEPSEPTAPDTFRRDLIARLYCEMMKKYNPFNSNHTFKSISMDALDAADTLIKRLEDTP